MKKAGLWINKPDKKEVEMEESCPTGHKTSSSFTWFTQGERGEAAHKTKGEERQRNGNSSSDLAEISQGCAAGTAGRDSLGLTEQ